MIPPELSTFLIAMSPVFELRGAIPLAIGLYGLPVWSAYFFAVVGNLVPSLSILLIGVLSNWLSHKFSFFDRFFTWLFARTRSQHAKKFERYKDFALILFVAIPLPFTGVWTASLAAFVFGIPFRRAFPLIAIGAIIAGIIVTLLTLGVLQIEL